ncbi:Fis family transcriptional regulator [Intrasporangium oryzae NRRL B-24470]|uniref:Fis family transcriptional regulator n=1 Tax=Intrasporangium oryzae NRRL B-24470 TaxID=1386089 RepID=W9G8M6_9MICO|nr:helix-turn-helix domain-containing protein [Intrasporangium oryzae]EWT01178.1 Fis family transcriptional regulator [Intrasporangium oryzae NRRL B-24470]
MGHRTQELELARDHFITSGVVAGTVREVVGQSWQRSTQAGVNPELVEPSYAAGLGESETHLLVGQVLASVADQLGDEPVSMIFADQFGRVIHRLCTDPALGKRLEKVSLAPGFTYAEESVGTNGIGTALLTRTPTLIVGSEHFTEPLMMFACAGAPSHHPISGALVGVLDLTCAAGVSNGLLLTYARSIAERIEAEILAKVSVSEMTLLRDYLAACRHATGPVLALGAEVVMMNRLTQQRLDAADRTALVARTGDAIGEHSPLTLVADLPSGTVARLDYRPSSVGARVVGGVFRVQLHEPSTMVGGKAAAASRPVPVNLPGVAGTSPEWVRAIMQVLESHRTNTWVVIEGEPGVGTFSLARGVHLAQTPGRHFRVLDAAAAAADPEGWFDALAEELDAEEGTLVIRHLDLLPAQLVEPVSTLLVQESGRSHSAPGRWVVATRTPSVRNEAVETQIVPCFDRTVVLEPLRHRPEDIRVVIPYLLRSLSASPGRELQISSAALNQLARHPWPRNVAQLRDTLRKIMATKRSGTIELADLPPECMAVGRRSLTPLEALERDAITRALDDHGGNKALAARHLGMSRATIYRKIRGYMIDSRP